MPFSSNQKIEIKNIITSVLREKFKNYTPETNSMPFHYRLLGKDRMALFSFIQSLNTTFGTSIYEPVAVAIAKTTFEAAEKQYKLPNAIYEDAQKEIQRIINHLSTSKNSAPNKLEEIERIRKFCKSGQKNALKTVKVDLFLKSKNGTVYMFDLKTATPNVSNFKDFKRTLLEWAALYLTEYPAAKVQSCIAIPYNPYEPEPYERWTLKGMLDFDGELMVGREFWDFLGGQNTYDELLDCFEMAGIELRPEIDGYFGKFK